MPGSFSPSELRWMYHPKQPQTAWAADPSRPLTSTWTSRNWVWEKLRWLCFPAEGKEPACEPTQSSRHSSSYWTCRSTSAQAVTWRHRSIQRIGAFVSQLGSQTLLRTLVRFCTNYSGWFRRFFRFILLRSKNLDSLEKISQLGRLVSEKLDTTCSQRFVLSSAFD